MKCPIAILMLILSTGATLFAQSGGTYSIHKSVVSGGGGTSSGGTIRVRGTAGQPEAGDMSGGTYRVSGGFWSPASTVCTQADPVTLEPSPLSKSRYLSLAPGNAGVEVGFRVTPLNVAGLPDANGLELWVGPPRNYPEEDRSDAGRTFVGAALQCAPYFADWGTIEVLQVFGAEVAPGSNYEIHAVSQACYESLGASADFGTPLEVSTGKWGDVAPLYDGDDPNAIQPDFNDIAALVGKFLAEPTAPLKAHAQLQPNVVFPNRPIDFKDIASDVAAFLGTPYVESVAGASSCTCPPSVTCGATACASDTQCTPGFCIGGFCTDACGRCAP